VEIGVTSRRPALIELLAAQEASPVIVPKGRSSGWFDVRGAAAVPALHYHRNPTVVFEGG